ncbi:MAG: phage tail protein, partial [Candidatus Omnitrophota bacterium]|nr:phage tail protein [Candidatus Omnitrophota bacterium]
APGQYDIKVTRTSEDSQLSPLKQGDLAWVQVDEIKTDDHAYPNTALLGVEALADDQLSGAMPNFTCIVKGRKVGIPNILNDTTPVDWEDYYWNNENNEYRLLVDDTPLSWDGTTYVDKWSANPIWCMKDLLLNKRYGLGEFIDSEVLDDELFLEMSRYCEEKVPDGLGGYEKRFSLDVVIDSSAKALDVISQLSASFRGLPFYSEGIVKLRIDKNEDPVQLFTMGNIIKDSFSESWKSIKEVPNVIEVQYLDKDKDYKQEVIAYVDEAALTSGDPMRKKQVRIFTTHVSQAIREARYALKIAKYINRVVSFKAGIDAIACQAGDVISISHDVPQWGFSGRTLEGSTTIKVVVDQNILVEDGKSYKIMVQFKDDTIEERLVTNTPGVTDEITVSSPFSQVPALYDKYAFGETNKVKKDFRIISMAKNDKNEVEIQAVEHNANVYDDSAITLPVDNYSMLDLTIPSVTDLKLTERLIKLLDGTIENCIDVWFDIPKQNNFIRRFSKAKVYLSDDNSTWKLRGETNDRVFNIIGDIVDGATYYVKVVTVTEDNEGGSFVDSPSDQITIVGKSAPPSDVSSFLVNQSRDRHYFGWTEIDDVDVLSYEIRWGADWDSGIIEATIQGNHYLTTNLRTGT